MNTLRTELGLSSIVRAHAQRLARAGVLTPDVDARILAAHVLGCRPWEVAFIGGVDGAALERLESLVAQRSDRVPLQHITGETGFRGLTLTCRPGVFIPRPETEVLAGLAIASAPSIAVEPCTGTGAVALALAAEVPGVRVVACDASPDAVALAGENLARIASAGKLAEGAQVEIHEGDLLAEVPAELRGSVDLVVANPPYLRPDELVQCEPEVRDHDPRAALVAGPHGNEVIDRLIDEARAWLRDGGSLMFELADVRIDAAVARASEAGYVDVVVHDDLTGRERIVSARWPG